MNARSKRWIAVAFGALAAAVWIPQLAAWLVRDEVPARTEVSNDAPGAEPDARGAGQAPGATGEEHELLVSLGELEHAARALGVATPRTELSELLDALAAAAPVSDARPPAAHATGALVAPDGAWALVDGRVVERGASLGDGWRLEAVERDRLVLAAGERRAELWVARSLAAPAQGEPRAQAGAEGVAPRPTAPRGTPELPFEDARVVALELAGAPLADALALLARARGMNLLVDAAANERVDASFPSVRLDAAFASLLARHGLALVEAPAGVFRASADAGRELRAFALASLDADARRAELVELVGDAGRVQGGGAGSRTLLVEADGAMLAAVEAWLAHVDGPARQVRLELEIGLTGGGREPLVLARHGVLATSGTAARLRVGDAASDDETNVLGAASDGAASDGAASNGGGADGANAGLEVVLTPRLAGGGLVELALELERDDDHALAAGAPERPARRRLETRVVVADGVRTLVGRLGPWDAGGAAGPELVVHVTAHVVGAAGETDG